MIQTHFDAIVIGAGPAGLTAGIYLSRARTSTLILNTGTVGGQMILTHEIANYPGLESVSGYALSSSMKKQAKAFGTQIKSILGIEDMQLHGDIKRIRTNDGTEYTANAILLAPGGRSRWLGVKGEDAFRGQGISYCATCDGEFFTDKEIIVVGGGNSALEEAVSLTKYASKVTIVHQFDYFEAFQHAIDEAKANPKIHFLLQTIVEEFIGDGQLQAVRLKDNRTQKTNVLEIQGAFVFIGYQPNTEFIQDRELLNERGEIVVNADMETQIEGVYAAGDCTAKKYRQITTAVGDATIAALAATAKINQVKKELQKQAISV